MAQNLVASIQQNLEYPKLIKIDPNTQDIKNKEAQTHTELLAQSCIPAILAGIFKLSRTDEGCLKILNYRNNDNALAILFDGNESQLVEKIAQYAAVEESHARSHLENIAKESIKELKEYREDTPDAQKLESFMNDQRHNILVYLPAALNLGDLIKDNSLDDRTNKMEGPISNLMHKIEDKFSHGGES